ncbi:MAG: type II secretion system secretin GspD [Deltaproteobacteria bacterium]|nr:type II secretion system secretin GspD [Deltaproteobacteria bacterium]
MVPTNPSSSAKPFAGGRMFLAVFTAITVLAPAAIGDLAAQEAPPRSRPKPGKGLKVNPSAPKVQRFKQPVLRPDKKKTPEEEAAEEAGKKAPPREKEPPPPPPAEIHGPSKAGITEVSPHSECLKAKGKGPFKLDFQKADIIDVVKFISELTCKNFIIPDNLRQGKITIISPQGVSVDEAYQAFLSALEVNKLTIVPTGRYLKLMGQRDSISSTIPTIIGDQKYPFDDRMVTKLVKLEYVDANTLTPTIKQLASKDGDVFTYQPTNTLIISDTGNNLFRLEQIIRQLDVPGGEEEIQLVQVNFALASQLAEKLIAIYDVKAQGAKPQAGPPPKAAPGTPQPPGAEPAEVRVSKILSDDRTNKLIIIATPRSFKEILEVIKKLDVPVAGEGQVHVYYLDNADAEQLANTLAHLSQGAGPKPGTKVPPSQAGQKAGVQVADLFSGEVKITADRATNSLVVIANSNDFKSLVNVIRQLDIRRKQVFVEAVIMEVTLDKTKDFGFAFSGGMAGEYGGKQFPIFGGTMLGGLNSIMLDPASLAQLGGFMTGVQGPAVEGVQFGSSKISLPSFGAILRALQTNSDVNVLSTPHILTTDNEDAEILVGQNIPYQSGFTSSLGGVTGLSSFTPIVSIQRQDVALKMKLKPQINNSDYVRLNIDEEISEVAGTDPMLGPTTSKRSAKTVVVVRDQQTVAIGGLMRDNQAVGVSKVPFLGDIPIIGWLFRNKHSKVNKTNLLLFLTPYIIKDKDDFRKIFERKMKERQEFVQRFYGAVREYEIYIDFSKKHGPFDEINKTIEAEMQKAENEGPGVEGETVITPKGEVAPKAPAPPAPQPPKGEIVPKAPPQPPPEPPKAVPAVPEKLPEPAEAAPDRGVEEKIEVGP